MSYDNNVNKNYTTDSIAAKKQSDAQTDAKERADKYIAQRNMNEEIYRELKGQNAKIQAQFEQAKVAYEQAKTENTGLFSAEKAYFRASNNASDMEINTKIALGRWNDSIFTAHKFSLSASLFNFT